jgi:RNA polymerase sigma factor (sigma-70 family)
MPAPLLKLLSLVATESTDAELLGRFVTSRDESAFAELVRRHGPAVYRVCRRLVGRSSADDAFQATFLVLACRARSVRNARSVGSWLIGVAGRVSRQVLRRDRRAGGVSPLLDAAERPAHAGRSPDTAELAAVLDDELTRLPDRLRAPVVLCLLDGRTQEQAAAELGGSVRTLRRRLDQARALLRLRLERRGVVPAVAAGLVACVGGPSVAVPPELAGRAVAGVAQFLAGGPVTPAAVVAKGVVASMVKLKTSAAVAMASVTAVLIGLGVGWAGDKPPTDPLLQPPPLQVDPPLAGPPSPPPAEPLIPPPVQDLPGPGRPVPATMTRTANFVVYGPSDVVTRAVANEAVFQRVVIAKKWLGKVLPDWKDPCEVRVVLAQGTGGGSSTFNFGEGKSDPLALRGARMDLRGPLETILTTQLPHEVTHAVLATHFGKPLPRWADEGIAVLAEPPQEQANHDVRCREVIGAGRGIRLRQLFRMNEYPNDTIVAYAQGHSVVRFLLTRNPKPRSGQRLIDVNGTAVRPEDPLARRHGLLTFLQLGLAGDWEQAGKEVYGFESVGALEAAWLEWMKTPASKPTPAAPPVVPTPAPPDDKPDLIPPTKLPGGGPIQ